MNKLSWLIYWTGIADGMSSMLGFLTFVSFIFAALATGWWALVAFNQDEEVVKASEPYMWRFRRTAIAMLIVFTSLYLLLPTRQTLILIAGSEMGERIVKSEQVQGIVNPGLDMIKLWIGKETAKLTAPEKK